jgi:SAM-dependent methyltransferase
VQEEIMVQSKGWHWEVADKSIWLKPTEDSYYLANKWKEKGYKTILDLGSGLGRNSIYFAQQGFSVSSIDISEYGVNHLKSWANNENLEINIKLGDILSLDFPDNCFDCVFAYHVISHTDTIGIKKIISEIERCTKSKGEIYVSFSSKEHTVFLAEDAQRADENTIFKTEEPEVGVPHFHVNLHDIVSLLQNFDIEKIRHIQYCNLDNLGDTAKYIYYYVNAILK